LFRCKEERNDPPKKHKETALMNLWGLYLSSTDFAMFQEKKLIMPIILSICSPQARQHQQSYID
jgi:hypothetical protein